MSDTQYWTESQNMGLNIKDVQENSICKMNAVLYMFHSPKPLLQEAEGSIDIF